MLLGAQQEKRLRDCMFPWTMMDETGAQGDSELQTTTTDGERQTTETPADERPLACRAWCVEHAEEL